MFTHIKKEYFDKYWTYRQMEHEEIFFLSTQVLKLVTEKGHFVRVGGRFKDILKENGYVVTISTYQLEGKRSKRIFEIRNDIKLEDDKGKAFIKKIIEKTTENECPCCKNSQIKVINSHVNVGNFKITNSCTYFCMNCGEEFYLKDGFYYVINWNKYEGNEEEDDV